MTENDHQAVGVEKFGRQLDEAKAAKTAPDPI
jgi:hypothetical protein